MRYHSWYRNSPVRAGTRDCLVVFSSVSGPFWLLAIVNLALWAPAAEYMPSNSGYEYIRPPTLSTFPFTFIYRVYSRPLQNLPASRSLGLLFCYLLALYVRRRKKRNIGKKMYAMCNERIVSLVELALNPPTILFNAWTDVRKTVFVIIIVLPRRAGEKLSRRNRGQGKKGKYRKERKKV